MAAITGTADDAIITTVTKELTLREPLIIRISPNRENNYKTDYDTDKKRGDSQWV